MEDLKGCSQWHLITKCLIRASYGLVEVGIAQKTKHNGDEVKRFPPPERQILIERSDIGGETPCKIPDGQRLNLLNLTKNCFNPCDARVVSDSRFAASYRSGLA